DAADGRYSGPRLLRAESAGDSHRRAIGEEPVSVHAAWSGHHRFISAIVALPDVAGTRADADGRDIRPPQPKPAAHDPHRPAAGAVVRCDATGDRECSRERVQPATDLDDLYADQRVLGGDGDGPERAARRRRVAAVLCAGRQWTAGTALRRRVLRADDGAAQRRPFGA